MHFSKAFDTINHKVLVAKPNAYGFSEEKIRFIFSYLNNRKQRVKINKTFNLWRELLYGVPQGSVFEPTFLNIYLNDLFLFLNKIDISNFTNDTTPFVWNKTLQNY